MNVLEGRDWDAHRFPAYVRRIISEAVKREPTQDEDSLKNKATENEASDDSNRDQCLDPGWYGTYVPPFIQKVIHLLQPIIDRGLGESALGILVLLKTLLRGGNPRVFNLSYSVQHEVLDWGIQEYLRHKQETMIAINKRVREKENAANVWPRRVNTRFGLSWERSTPNRSPYWNFAQATRVLRTAYLSEVCPAKLPPSNGRVVIKCFRAKSVELLNYLQVRA